MVESLAKHRRVIESMRNLKRLGFKCALEELDKNTVMLAVDIDSMLDFLRRSVSRRMSYRKFYIEVNLNEKLFIIYMWRGGIPTWLREKIMKTWK